MYNNKEHLQHCGSQKKIQNLSGGQLGNRRDGCSEVPKLGAFAPDTSVTCSPAPDTCPLLPSALDTLAAPQFSSKMYYGGGGQMSN